MLVAPGLAVTARAGEIRLQLANGSVFPHSVGVRPPPPPPQAGLGLSPVAAPGTSASVDVTLAPGAYEIYCGVGGHADAGMVVALTVTP